MVLRKYTIIFPKAKSTGFFFREFQPIASTLDDSSLLSDQDTNQFLV